MVGKGGRVVFPGERRTVTSRLQADLPQPVARRGRLDREDLEPLQGPERAAVSRFLLSHHLRLPDESGRSHPLFVWISAWSGRAPGGPRISSPSSAQTRRKRSMSGTADGGTPLPSSGVPASVIRRANPLGETTTKAPPGPSPVTCTAGAVPAGGTTPSAAAPP